MRNAFAYELTKRGFRVQRQVLVPIIYDGVQLEEPLRLDLLVEEAVIIEVKSVEKMHPVFDANAYLFEAQRKTSGIHYQFQCRRYPSRH
jgi:GxxExxY protein